MTKAHIIKTAVIGLFICAVCFTFLTPLRDNDFFWHLATGKWIAEHKELPKTDPFAYTTSPKAQEEFFRAKIILTQYWLANLLQYGIFSLAGFDGILGLRLLIVLLTLFIIAAHVRKKNLNAIPITLLLVPLSAVLMIAKGDRPNQMTFLLTALFMYLADALKRGEKKGYLLPLVFLLWANMHGGFLLGAVIAVIMVASEVIKKLFAADYTPNRRVIVVMLLTLCTGLLNPNGYTMMYSMFFEYSSVYYGSIFETMSPLYFARVLKDAGFLLILGVSLLIAVWYFLSRIFERPVQVKEKILNHCDELAVVAFLIAASFTAVRFIPLLVIILVPVAAPLFSGKFRGLPQKLSACHASELLLLVISLWWILSAYPHTILNRPQIDQFFPDDAVQYIKENEMKGHFFNYYDWGGYLIWQFYPEPFVFIDGRGIILQVYDDATAILTAQKGTIMGKDLYLYGAIFDAYSVRHVIMPATDAVGATIPLLNQLVNDPQWHLIFTGRNSLIFTKDQTGPDYPKSLSYVVVVSNALEFERMTPDNPVPYLTAAKANISLGRQKVAIEGLEEALKGRASLRGGPVEKALDLLKQGKDIP